MLSSQAIITGIAVAVASGISLVALLLAKTTSLQGKPHTIADGYYECGFFSENQNFVFLGQRSTLVSLYLVIETIIAWLLTCCSFTVANNAWSGDIFVRVLIAVTATTMTLVYRHTIPRKRRRPGGYVSEEDNR